MNLKQAQEHFLRDAKYRQIYEKGKGGVTLAMHLLAIRKEAGISHVALANELGISKYEISKVENLRGGVKPWVISVLVRRFEVELRQRGIAVEKWFVAKPPDETQTSSPIPIDVSRASINQMSRSRENTARNLPIQKARIDTESKKESKS